MSNKGEKEGGGCPKRKKEDLAEAEISSSSAHFTPSLVSMRKKKYRSVTWFPGFNIITAWQAELATPLQTSTEECVSTPQD